MNAQIELTQEQAIALSFAFAAHRTACELLDAGDQDYLVWQGMRDEKLVELFGMGHVDIHNFAYGLKDAA